MKMLCLSGARIGYHSREPNKASVPQELRSLAEEHGASIELVSGAFPDSKGCSETVEGFCSRWGGIDAFVQLHGDASSKSIDSLSDDDWQHALQTNLISPFFLARSAMEFMIRQHGGRIVLTSTASAKHGGGADTIPYGTAKAGVECVVKALAKSGASDNILVNAIAPGFIDTSFHSKRLGRSPAQLSKRQDLVPLKRAGTAEEVAATILFLLSPAASFITGQTLEVSGGDWL